jgi:hypothetical protein
VPKFGGRLPTTSDSGMGIRLGVFVPYQIVRAHPNTLRRRVWLCKAHEKESRYENNRHTHYVYANIDL